MATTKINDWMTLIANVSVVAGIVFLAAELRQNTNAIRAQTRDSVTEKQLVVFQSIATTPELAEAWSVGLAGGLEALEPAERPMLLFWVIAVLRAWENEYSQYERGLFSSEEFLPRMERWRRNMEFELYRSTWAENRDSFSPAFRAAIDAMVSNEAAGS